MRGERARQLRAGLFLLGALAVLVAAVVILGRTHTLFAKRVTLHTWFANAGGLAPGAQVRLAGVTVGNVQSIRFAPDPREKAVRVTLSVDERYLGRIRKDSVARLTTEGLLGDTLIDITVGSAEAPPVGPGGALRSREAVGLEDVVASVKEGISEVAELASAVRQRVEGVFTEELGRDLSRTAHAAADLAERIRDGPGLGHALIYDRRLEREGEALVRNTKNAIGRVERILARVEKGPGAVHELIAGDEGRELVAELARAARETADVLKAVREGPGLLHTLVHEKDTANLLENLTALSATLKRLGDDVAAGKGTVGALLRDPTVYEDLKTILGNIKRSRLLRSLIRYTIKKQGLSAP